MGGILTPDAEGLFCRSVVVSRVGDSVISTLSSLGAEVTSKEEGEVLLVCWLIGVASGSDFF